MKDIRMANKHMKISPIISVIREMQIKITMRHHFIPSRMAIIKKAKRSTGEDVEKLEPAYTAGGNVGGAAALENNVAIS